MHKKSILALALIMVPLLAQAAVTQGQLTFTWQATVPAGNIVSSAWKFTDATGGDYVPRPITLRATINEDKSLNLLTQTPATFEIRSKSTGNLNTIAAYLASTPIGNGVVKPLVLKNTLAAPGSGEVVVVLNNQLLKLGSNNAVTIQSTVNNTAASMSLALYAKVAQNNYTPGSSISISTPIVFSVDVAGGANT
ncbi:fimbrial protein [Edwardsiella tarda]